MTTDETLQAIAHDLDLCDVGLIFATGALRRRYLKQRKACLDELARLNRADGLNVMTDADLLDELLA